MAFKNEKLFNFIHNDRIINYSKTTFCLLDRDQKFDNITVGEGIEKQALFYTIDGSIH